MMPPPRRSRDPYVPHRVPNPDGACIWWIESPADGEPASTAAPDTGSSWSQHPSPDSLGPRVHLFGHRGGNALPFLHDRKPIRHPQDLLDVGHHMVLRYREAAGVAADILVFAGRDGDQARAVLLPALTHNAQVVPRGTRRVSLLEPFIDLPADRLVLSDPFLPALHLRNSTLQDQTARNGQ